MEHEELLRQIVAETTKGLEPLVKALADIEQAKQPKNEVKLATREELNSVMSQLIPGYQPTPKPEKRKNSGRQRNRSDVGPYNALHAMKKYWYLKIRSYLTH
jgi:hypothetical protein